jgi:hypothetical protein
MNKTVFAIQFEDGYHAVVERQSEQQARDWAALAQPARTVAAVVNTERQPHGWYREKGGSDAVGL